VRCIAPAFVVAAMKSGAASPEVSPRFHASFPTVFGRARVISRMASANGGGQTRIRSHSVARRKFEYRARVDGLAANGSGSIAVSTTANDNNHAAKPASRFSSISTDKRFESRVWLSSNPMP
jgi:hypothetical protein